MKAATDWINWPAVAGLMGLFFLVLIVIATVWLGARFKNVTFHEILMTYGKLLLLGSVAAIAIGGTFIIGLMTTIGDETQRVVPGVSGEQVPGQGEPSGDGG